MDAQVILLNGTSSAGKSSLAQEICAGLGRPSYLLAVDEFRRMRRGPDITAASLPGEIARTAAGFHRVIAGLAAAGHTLVVDHVLSNRARLRELLVLLPAEAVVFVGVRCPLDVVVRRERERGDRVVGTAAAQYSKVHAHRVYDVEVDTSRLTPAECAEHVLATVEQPARPTAFTRLRAAMATELGLVRLP
ncbi:conserved hypothetical protein [Streptomyces sp. SPB78]|uniref:chloramphenicol phosphotransferase CPT family protein n=1 Tax=Streptomyces sp. (strain SPB78) TaxID=591157 RepID=UPI0001DED90E|nr:AAA family ATPase [Streptomyces sp. SPB78]EFL00777.1 conserved hypothetical protein [Streptomyces sp. SPB78]